MQHPAHGGDGGTPTDHVFPRLPVRQWALSVPKRLRYYMQRDGAALNMVLRIFLRVIAQSLQDHCAGAAQVDRAAPHIGAVDGMFEEVEVPLAVEGEADAQPSPPGIVFHPASAIDETAVAQVQTGLRPPTLCHGSSSQRGRCPGVPLRQTAQRAWLW